MIYNNILEAMGNTPVIKLNHMVPENAAQILVKFEGLNVGGSIKTRTAYNMICDAEAKGLINENTIIVEPTSGNQGIGLSLVGAVKGYKVRIIMPDSVSEERRKLMEHYGAEVVLVHDDDNIGECIKECLATALRMQEEDPNVFVPQQFENPANPQVHYETTGPEIYSQLDGNIDYFVAGAGSGGTFSGVVKYLKEQNPDITGVLADPYGSTIGGGEHFDYNIEGIGNDFIADTMDITLVDKVIKINDDEAFEMSRRLAKNEGILAGSSSGAALAASLKLAEEIGSGNIVTVFPDRGDRYLSKGLFE